ncbi:hypothetical protein [Streptomyces sp. NPDC059009]|uniref:hypothetical protein n=1 Tax=Streptomyces sp. NPDC059009 TaxID=3346694 RepID=UPI0036B5CE39
MSGGPAFDTGHGYALRVPDAWYEIDLRPATRDASAADLVRARMADAPELRERRADVVKLLCKQAAAAWDSGAVFCAVMAEPVADGLLPASVTVSFVRGPLDADSGAGDRVAPLLAPLAVKRPKKEGDPWTEVTTVDLPEAGGLAARSYGVEDVHDPNGGPGSPTIRVATMQTFVPVPGVNRVAIVSCSSPAIEVAQGLHDVFDAITSTFALFEAGKLIRKETETGGEDA